MAVALLYEDGEAREEEIAISPGLVVSDFYAAKNGKAASDLVYAAADALDIFLQARVRVGSELFGEKGGERTYV